MHTYISKNFRIVFFSRYSSEDIQVLLFFLCLGQGDEDSTPY